MLIVYISFVSKLLVLFSQYSINGFQISIKRPTSGGQTCDQEAAVQQTFHLERSSFLYLSGKDLM